jgi:ketosteroid isomerase-like protein
MTQQTSGVSSPRSDRERLLQEFMDSLVAKDMARLFSIWHEEAVLEFPYAPEGLPTRLEGKDAVRAHLEHFPDVVEITGFPKRRLYELQDENQGIAEVTCSGKVVSNGNDYNISYVWIFEVRDGLLYRLRDYWNPLAVMRAFGGSEVLTSRFGEG